MERRMWWKSHVRCRPIIILFNKYRIGKDWNSEASAQEAQAALQEAEEAVAALFEDDTKAVLAQGVDQDAIDAAQDLVDALVDYDEVTTAEINALQADIDVAKALL